MRLIRQKLFAEITRSDNIFKMSEYSDKICIELMKLVELYNYGEGKDINHWFTNLINSFYKDFIKSSYIVVGKYKPQLGFIKVFDKDSVSKFVGDDFVNNYMKLSSENYIKFLKDYLLKMRDSRLGIKYLDAINSNGGFIYSDEDYILFYKYIALCITGQMNYTVNNFWEDFNMIRRTKVDLNFRTIYNPMNNNSLRTIIANCLFQIKGRIPDDGNYILEYL